MSAYRAICCSRSCILARLETFIGFGLGNEGSGVESFCGGISYHTVAAHFMPRNLLQRTLLNQSDISDLVEKSFSSCDCISRAVHECQPMALIPSRCEQTC